MIEKQRAAGNTSPYKSDLHLQKNAFYRILKMLPLLKGALPNAVFTFETLRTQILFAELNRHSFLLF